MKKTSLISIVMISIFALIHLSFAEEMKKNKGGGGGQRKNDTYKEEYTFNAAIPVVSIETIQGADDNNYQLYSFDQSSFTTEVGKPKLPFVLANVYLPPAAQDQQDVQVEVVDSAGYQEPVLYPVYPVEEQVLVEQPDGVDYVNSVFNIDQNFYNTSQGFYPQAKAQIQEVAHLRGLQYVTVKINPIQYDPSTKTANIDEDVTLKLTWTSKFSANRQPPQSYGRTFDTAVTNLDLLNFNQSLNTPAAKPGSVSRPVDLLAGVPVDYLVITANDFYDSASVTNLANHRASVQGGSYRVSIVKAADIYAANFPDKLTGNITDTDKLLKVFIKYVFDHWNLSEGPDAHVEFVLLVGDAITDSNGFQMDSSTFVPAHLSTQLSWHDRIAADYWYSCISDAYPNYLDDDQSHDMVGDVFIGRFPVNTQIELENIANKTINFETTFPYVPNLGRSQAGLLSGFNLANSDHLNYTIPAFHKMRDDFISYPMESLESYRSDLTDDAAGRDTFKQQIKTNFNDGHLFTVVQTHGSKITWNDGAGTVFCAGNINCAHDDVLDLTNTQSPSIVLTGSCQTVWFDDPVFKSMGESFLTNNDRGAVAYIGGSRDTDGSALTDLAAGVLGEVFEKKDFILGRAFFAAQSNFNKSDLFMSQLARRQLMNLLGDPALDISKMIQASQKTDLTAAILNYDVVGNNVTLHTKIKNFGPGTAGNITEELYEGFPGEGGVRLAEVTIPVIPSNQETLQDITIPTQSRWAAGADFYLVIDGSAQVSELSETNNTSGRAYFSLASYQEIPIGSGDFPFISGSKVVWRDTRNGRSDIYMLDLGSDAKIGGGDDIEESVITISRTGKSKANPVVFENKTLGSKIVWRDYINGKPEVYALDLGRDDSFDIGDKPPLQVSANIPTGNFAPAIDGNNIAWYHFGPSDTNIYLYSMGTNGILGDIDDQPASLLSTGGTSQADPSISADKVVWQDGSNDGGDIYLYDLSIEQESRITTNASTQSFAKIFGNKIVWQDNRNRNDDVYLFDLGSDGKPNTHDEGEGEYQVTRDSSSQQMPSIYGTKIVWRDLRNQSNDFYIYDIGPDNRFGTADDTPETRVAIEPADYRDNPVIYDNKIVYAKGDKKVYMIDLDELNTQHLFVPDGFSTIQSAVNAASDGYTVHVAAGVYNESIDFGGKNIYLVADQGPAVTTIQASSSSAVYFQSNETRSAVLEGFTIIAADGNAIYINDASPTIKGNVITASNPFGYGIALGNGGPLIENNTITNCGEAGISTVPFSYPTVTAEIANNTISDNGYNGIQTSVTYGKTLIHHNRIIDNGSYGLWIERSDGRAVGYNDTSQITNNTIADNGLGGLAFLSSNSFTVSNNVISSNSGFGIYAGRADPYGSGDCWNITSSYNDFWNQTYPVYGQGVEGATGVIYTDPQLDGSYQLRSTSLCINTGDPAVFDLDGSRSDMGWLYYHSLIQNDSFEIDSGIDYYPAWGVDDAIGTNNVPDGWSAEYAAADSTVKFDGAKSMRLYVNDSRGYSVQDIPVEPNKTYRVSAYVKTDCEDSYCYGTILTECMDSNHVNIWDYGNCQLNTNPEDIVRLYGDNDWTRIEFDVKADNPSGQFLRAICYNTAGPDEPHPKGTGTVWCDSMSVVEKTAP